MELRVQFTIAGIFRGMQEIPVPGIGLVTGDSQSFPLHEKLLNAVKYSFCCSVRRGSPA